MRGVAAFPLLAVGLAAVLYGGLAMHRAYGINLPWEAPRHLDLCERRYDPVEAFPIGSSTRVLRLRPTVLALPIPLPELRPSEPSLPYGGCPALVVLDLGERSIEFAPLQGGP